MTYASILVSVGFDPDCLDRIDLAADLADRFNAHLIGVAARPLNVVVWERQQDPDAPDSDEKKLRTELRAAEVTFRNAVSTRKSVEWRDAVAIPAKHVVEQSRAADLVVLSRQGVADIGASAFSVSPGDVVMSLGRPMLVAPPGSKKLSGRRAVIGWKDTREARRAVMDALPLLKAATVAYVVASGCDADRSGVDDVGAYLKRHGINAVPRLSFVPDTNTADAILEVASDHNADLIVAGAYGHSRVREWAFGGVTHDLLQRAPICCLMSH
jgi:nucleotide-binding universal stress UspA family protein